MAEGWRKDGGNKIKLSMRMSEEMSERIISVTRLTIMNHDRNSFLRHGKRESSVRMKERWCANESK
jgi:hypothetical protein